MPEAAGDGGEEGCAVGIEKAEGKPNPPSAVCLLIEPEPQGEGGETAPSGWTLLC